MDPETWERPKINPTNPMGQINPTNLVGFLKNAGIWLG